jgi:hypothetical protein
VYKLPQIILDRLRQHKLKKKKQEQIWRLERQILALQYRRKDQKEIYEKSAGFQQRVEWLTENLLAWKKEKKDLANMVQEVTASDRRKIEQTCFYKEILSQLENDDQFRDSFYRFVFRNTQAGGKDAVDIAIQLPYYAEQLAQHRIDKAEGRFHDLFSMQQECGQGRVKRKFVSLKMDGQEIDISDEKTVVVFDQNNVKRRVEKTVSEVFFSIKQQAAKGEYQFVATKGVVRIGAYLNPCWFNQPIAAGIDVAQTDWHTELTPSETLTHDDVFKRYGAHPTYALLIARCGTPAKPNSEGVPFGGSHSWIEAVVPGRDKQYNVYPIGKNLYPWESGLQELLNLFGTKRATIRIESDILLTNNLTHAAYAFQASHAQVKKFWHKVGQDISKERNNELYFQMMGKNNCSSWVSQTLHFVFENPEMLPRLFEINALDANWPSPFNHVIRVLRYYKKLFPKIYPQIFKLIGVSLGASKGFIVGSGDKARMVKLSQNSAWITGDITLAGKLLQFCKDNSQENCRDFVQMKIGNGIVGLRT